MAFRDDLEAAHARIAALEAELARERSGDPQEREQIAAAEREAARIQVELGRELEAARREAAQLRDELTRTREDCERYVDRIRILQNERDQRRAPAVATSAKPVVLDRGASPVCPHCQRAGHVVALLRDAELTPGVCPQCASISLLR